MSVQSWQIPCPRCGWANSGALVRCAKCGQPLGGRPGMLVAGQSLSARGEQTVSTKVARPGGFLPRLIALIVDFGILTVVVIPLDVLWTMQLTSNTAQSGATPAVDTLRGSISFQAAVLLLWLFYFGGSWTILGATPGQLLMSLRVTDQNAGGLGFLRAVFRFLLFSVLFPLAIVSALMVAVSKNKRALHDLLAGTYVIQIVDREDAGEAGGLPPVFSAEEPEREAPRRTLAPSGPPPPLPVVVAAESGAAAYTPPVVPAPRPSSRPSPFVAPAFAPPAPPVDTVPPASAPPIDFPPMPMAPTPDIPPPPVHESGGGADAGLYAPPPMADPTPPFAAPAPPAPVEREIYTPRPVPPPPPEDTPTTDGDLPPFEFPPMAPPPEPHR